MLEKAKEHILKLFDLSMDAGLNFLKVHSSELPYSMSAVSVVQCLCNLFGGLLRRGTREKCGGTPVQQTATVRRTDTENDESDRAFVPSGIYNPSFTLKKKTAQTTDKPAPLSSKESLLDLISNIFVFSYTWALGGCFERTQQEMTENISFGTSDDSTSDIAAEQKLTRGGVTAREKFDALIYKLFTTTKTLKVKLPSSSNLIYSYYFNLNSNSFEPWKKLVAPSKQSAGFLNLGPGLKGLSLTSYKQVFSLFTDFNGLQYDASNVCMVPTVDLIRLAFLVSVLFNQHNGFTPNILLSGKPGVGKSQILSHLSKSLTSKKWQNSVISCVFGKPTLRYGEQMPANQVDDATCMSIHSHVSSELEGVQVQSMLEKHLIRHGRNALVPSKDKRVRHVGMLHTGYM